MAAVSLNRSASGAEHDLVVKAIIIGDSGVGKSSLLYRFTDNDWNPHYIATIGVDFKVMTFERESKIIKLQLWDTAGQERFRTITHTYYRGTHGVMLVFDVTNRDTFENICEWMRDVEKFSATDVPLLLVGNKCDLNNERQVPREEAEAMAKRLGCSYVETSAKNNIEIEAAFAGLVNNCVSQRIAIAKKIEKSRVPVKEPLKQKQSNCCK